jgi:enoyl-CoA hydratase/carnithine racemase
MEFERRAIAESGRSADFIEGSSAFIEKRAAAFKGV